MTSDSEWASLTSPEIAAAAEAGAIVVLPVGATEQHGPHLATGADTLFAARVASAAVARTGDIVLPPVAYGCSLGHTDRWAGTVSLDPRTMTEMIVQIGRWVHRSGFRKLVMVNGHATNGPPSESALLELRHELEDLRLGFVTLFEITPEISHRYAEDAADFHANEAETSLMLHLEPGLVSMDRAVDEPDRTTNRVLRYPMPSVSSSGVVGEPSRAEPERGAVLFGQLVDALAGFLRAARSESDPQW